MSDGFTPQVRALLDRLEPPALSADFADRLVAKAVLPPLPQSRKPRLRRRFALVVAAAGLVGIAAAAAVPVHVWRELPVIGDIVEWIDPARDEPAPAPARIEPAPAAPTVSELAMPQSAPPVEPEIRAVAVTEEALLPVDDRPAILPPGAEVGRPVRQPEPVERAREALPQPMREIPVAERTAPVETREAAAVVDTRLEPAPERIRPADTSETRQQIRERTATERQTARERAQRREPRTSRIN